ncbi:HlyD family type I secretion periplasmic adaptor subunit (plasmid) [Devosia sp. A8/3-2]|nr:HlyD family type I secretion periplasmic adaptor subunit [Devosia sp. A8/3-2]
MTALGSPSSTDIRSLRRHGWVGLFAIVGLFGGLVAWASLTEISGAIIAPGMLVVEDSAKRVQHPEGGIVAQLLVRNEDRVEQGQLLAALDQTAIAAALAISEAQLREAYAKEARLLAEIEGRSSVVLSGAALQIFESDELAALLDLEQRVLTARQQTKAGRIAQLREQIVQLERQREGLSLQKAAIERQVAVVRLEIVDFDNLYDKRLIAASRGTSLDKELASAEGELGRLVATLAESQAIAAERALQIEQVEDEYLTDALAELQEARRIIAEAGQRRIADQDRLTRTEIRAPQTGVVHESILHTVGGVAAAGETLMLIVPSEDPLPVNVRIEPIDIDKVAVGQEAVLRFSGLNPRTTPELFATVSWVAPDATQDPRRDTNTTLPGYPSPMQNSPSCRRVWRSSRACPWSLSCKSVTGRCCPIFSIRSRNSSTAP